ncbi:unnamed protein product [Medioppia subpectinata]|uniref:Chitin-binding type-2 domain-containing protein n=1 Tax=Medioppia subpectinata TaxID=1979941 RepID=A0A7R9PY67_9ACAR|nr:unnamed protein product [Medioppia subpectinata]CAG2105769.1 unnamed protein product [Medioppia subpectinata]
MHINYNYNAVNIDGYGQRNSLPVDCNRDGVFGEPGELGYTECVDGIAEFHSCGIAGGDENNHWIYDGERCVDPKYECPEFEGTFRHNNSHRLYYKCQQRTPTKHYCADNEVFDGLVCIRVVRGQVTSGSHLTQAFNCARDGTFADPESKTHYVVCEEGEANVFRCPHVHVENDKDRQWYEVFTRHKCVTPWECPEINGTYKLSRAGRVHFRCVDGIPYEHICPVGTVFEHNHCKPLFPAPQPRPHGYHCPNDGTFHDPETRHGYIVCHRGHPTHHACPGGLVFDGRTCVTVRHPVRPHTFICPNDGRFVDPESGRGYYVCLGGLASHYTCPEATLFDGTSCVSDHPFQCPASNGLFVNPRNHSEYYQCFYGRPQLRHCPRGSLFLGNQCVHRGAHHNEPIIDDRHDQHHHRDDRYKVLIRERDLVKFEFNNYIITDRFDSVAWKWNREIVSKK